MKKILLLILTSLLLILSIGPNASAGSIQLNDYTIGFSNVDPAIADLKLVDTMAFTAGRSLTILTDSNGDGLVSVGDTFVDYIAIHIKGFESAPFGDDITPVWYNEDVQLTIVAELTGTLTKQTADDFEFIFDAFDRTDPNETNFIEMYMDTDALNTSGPMTKATFSNLFTFSDGKLVEVGDMPGQGEGVNDGDYDYAGQDGRVDLQLIEIAYAPGIDNFELTADPGAEDIHDIYPAVFWDIDSNNDTESNIDYSVLATPFQNYFGISNAEMSKIGTTDADGASWAIFTSNDGTINKSAVPEPATILLFGTGMLWIAGLSRKKLLNTK